MSSFPFAQGGRPQRRPSSRGSAPRVGPLGITIAALAAIAGIVYASSIVWTEVLWFNQMRATRVLLTQWGAHIGLFLVGFGAMTAVVYLSMAHAYKHREASTRGEAAASLRAYQKALAPVRKLAFWGVALFFGFTAGARMAANWQTLLQFVNGSSFDRVDPEFGLDISFFVFTLPALKVLVSFLMSAAVICLVASLVVSYLYGTVRLAPRPHASKPARLQTGMLAAAVSLLIGANYWLGRYELLTSTNSSMNIDGAMYSDINATLPAHSILAVISVLVAVLFVVAAYRGTWRLPGSGIAVTVVAALVLGMAYPALIQQFRVRPNQRTLEAPYIQRNIDATLEAYGLDDVDYQTNYDAATTASAASMQKGG